ncbi:hypothetical protein GOP47_0004301 [Adiantum capillus-veneris]|uniref:non-specific serine/threonine protein kinase n=1 Tax=Adiantum capillus-veneris TaxID=13818 RepID=A0A9D4V7M3_ADICA|nr:hypothetical protein GOP47_0004301 [Adiantum capillus-veneris]
MADKKLRWQNQNHFLQARHGFDKGSYSPETIAVALPLEEDQAFDLLCWTINMAARPGDTIVALRQRDYDTMQKFIAGNVYKMHVVSTRFKPLQELCNIKQVHLEVKGASVDVAEKLLVEEVLAMNATMVVVTVSGHNLKRHAHRRGNFLLRQLPAGCSLAVVKDYRILCYKENKFGAGLTQRGQGCGEEVASLQFQPTLFTVKAWENSSQLDTSIISNIWSPKKGWMNSPKRVLDSSDAFVDSYGSPSSNDHSGLSRSSLKRPLMSCSLSSHCEENYVQTRQNCSCLSIRRSNIQECGMHIFLSARQRKRLKAWKFTLQSLISSVWPWKWANTRIPIMGVGTSWKVLTYEEISKATSRFNKDNLVGKGGHSEVYKGILGEGELVAVKRLIRGDTGDQRTVDFLTEIGMICHALHPNITPLVGYCIEKGLYLVYQFMRHGNLAAWLYGGRSPTLKWAIRYKIALGIAKGLNYLHSGCQRRIIHRDIKASNILLGSDFEPQISDFGLGKWLPNQCSHHVLSPVEGTFGYLAPEYVMNGIVDEKTDVFSYGVLLLELITGRKPIEGLQSSLVLWARPFLETLHVAKLVDEQLNGDYDPQEMQSMMMAAALCVQQLPECRPCMAQVLQMLTDEQTSDGPDSFSAFSSQSFCLQDAIFDGDYSSTHYQDDLRRHREIALAF